MGSSGINAGVHGKKDLRSSMSCSECRARDLDPYWVQYTTDEEMDRENIIEHYRSLHYVSYCTFIKDAYDSPVKDETLFEREVVKKVQTRADYDELMNKSAGDGGVAEAGPQIDEVLADKSGSYSGRLSSTEDELECGDCKRTFMRSRALEQHRNAMCSVCDIEMPSCALQKHTKMHESPGVSGRVNDMEGVIDEQARGVKRKHGNDDHSGLETPPKATSGLVARLNPSLANPVNSSVKNKRKKKTKQFLSNRIVDESSSSDDTETKAVKSTKREGKGTKSSGGREENPRSRHSSGATQHKKQKKCLKCDKLIEMGAHFKRHIVTHIKERWTEEEVPRHGPDDRECPRNGCKQVIKGWSKLINHLAIHHGELTTKLEEHGESLSDYEKQVHPQTGTDQLRLDIISSDRNEVFNMHNIPELQRGELGALPPEDKDGDIGASETSMAVGGLLDVLNESKMTGDSAEIEMDNAEADKSRDSGGMQNLCLPNGNDRGGGGDTDSDKTEMWEGEQEDDLDESITIHDNTIAN